eukprot:TRINITY_DN11827_c0_g1_i3.p1 TRINITY_DN11827_c0_g1~~TRINITY_DN11827_c0_g1_i3.p1  ORF type:complete len:1631 (+),score=280.01 TRINITY_DN11827_c0_g1_i3:73-4893(+)
MRQWLALLLIGLQFAASQTPDCAVTRDECMYQRVGYEFTDSIIGVESGSPITSERHRQAVCNVTNWQISRTCLSQPALQMRILDTPGWDIPFIAGGPIMPGALSMVGKIYELDFLEGSGAASTGCRPSDFVHPTKNYTGKIVMLTQGGCTNMGKGLSLKSAGAAAGVLLSLRPSDTIHRGDLGFFPQPPTPPIISVPRQGFDQFAIVVKAGLRVKVSIITACEAVPEEVFDDGCGNAEAAVSMMGGCAGMEEPENRLCEACPLEMHFSIGGTDDVVCLMGNMLVPLRAKNFLWSSRDNTQTEARFVYLEGLAGGGCRASDYAGYAGEIVSVWKPLRCNLFDATYSANTAGVRAIIFFGDSSQKFTQLAEGYSELISIPVHSVSASSVKRFVSLVHSFPLTGSARVVQQSFVLKRGALPPQVIKAPPPLPPAVAVEASVPALEMNALVILSFLLVLLLLSAVVISAIYQRSQNEAYKQSIGPMRHIKGFSLPLVVISSTVSIAFLAMIAAVAFQLAYQAGKDSTDTALEDGRQAVETQYRSAATNINMLNHRWRDLLLSSAVENVHEFFGSGRRGAANVAAWFRNYDGLWTTFFSFMNPIVGVMYSTGWQVTLRSQEGFLLMVPQYDVGSTTSTSVYMSDARPLADRRKERYNIPADMPPLGQKDLAETNNGWDYHYASYSLEQLSGRMIYHRLITRTAMPLYEFVGANFNNASRLVQDMLPGNIAQPVLWVRSPYSAINGPGYSYKHPITMLVPLFDGRGNLRGTMEFSRDLSDLNLRVQAAVTSVEGAENVTAVVMQTSGEVYSAAEGASRFMGAFWDFVHFRINQTLTLDNIRAVELNAFGHYAAQHYGGLQTSGGVLSGTFDQAQHYKEVSPWTVARFKFEGTTQDDTPNRYSSKLEGATLATDPERSGVLRLTGQDSFVVFWNLTTDMAEIAATRSSPPGAPWRSTEELFTHPMMTDYGKEGLAFETRHFPVTQKRLMLAQPIFESDVSFSVWVKPEAAVADTANPTDREPLLLTDGTRAGIVRFYANGVLKYGMVQPGCLTAPISGGPPVGKWTHFAFTASRTQRVCRVYINGRLHSEVSMKMSLLVAVPQMVGTSGEPYRVGRGLVGMIDEVQFVNTTLSETEVVQWQQTGSAKLSVAPRKWSYNLVSESVEGFKALPLLVGVFVPEKDILRRVDAENALMRKNLDIQERNTRKRLDQERNESMLVLAWVALGCVLAFMTFNAYITGPVTNVAEKLVDVASFRVSDVEARHSIIAEISAISEAMAVVCKNLKEFKSYIPKSLGLDEDETEAESQEESSAPDNSSRASSGCQSRTSTNNTSASDITAGNRAALAKRAAHMGSMQKKRISFMATNVVDFLSISANMSDKDVLELHGGLVSLMLVAVSEMKGIPETFAGDRFCASWNAIRACGGHKHSSLVTLLNLRERLSTLREKIRISGALVSGDARVGNMGTEGMKRFSYITGLLPFAFALERHARNLGISALAEETIIRDNETVVAQSIGTVMYKKRASGPVHVFIVDSLADAGGNDEWMYEMQNMQAKNPYITWNKWVKHVVNGQWEEAKELALSNQLREKDTTETFREALWQGCREQNYVPFDLVYC